MTLNYSYTDTDRENLAMRIMMLRDEQIAKKKMTIDEILIDALKIVKEYEIKFLTYKNVEL